MIPKLAKVTFLAAKGWKAMFSDMEPVFHISTKTISGTEWLIKRSYKDFEILRQYLLEQHPDCIVPTLPVYPKREQDDYAFWGKIGGLMVQFLEQCFLAPSLKFNKLLCLFMIKGDKEMSELYEQFEKEDRPRNIS